MRYLFALSSISLGKQLLKKQTDEVNEKKTYKAKRVHILGARKKAKKENRRDLKGLRKGKKREELKSTAKMI